MSSGLEIKNLSFRYRSCEPWVFRGVDLTVRPGECAAVIGRNGAGKSTLASAICGLFPGFMAGELSGEALFDGGRIFAPAYVRQDLDSQLLFEPAGEELSFFRKYSSSNTRGGGESDFQKIGGRLFLNTAHLSTGQKQMFLLGCALEFSACRLAVMDEPDVFLDETARQMLALRVRSLKEKGWSVLLFGHDLSFAAGEIDSSYSLSCSGLEKTLAAASSPGEYISGNKDAGTGTAVLAKNISFSDEKGIPLLKNFSFELRSGIASGLCGPNGCGKTTVARLLCGQYKAGSGEFFYSGRSVDRRWLQDNVRLVGAQPSNGLLFSTLRENIEYYASKSGISSAGALLRAGDLGLADKLQRRASELSRGEKQKALCLCAMLSDPEALIVDEPAAGLDGEGVNSLASVLGRYAGGGGALLLISHSREWLSNICPEIISMSAPEAVAP